MLIVLSSADELPLQNGKTYRTGYYLNELVIPAEAFSKAGYQLVFADPKGNRPATDPGSVTPFYFGGSEAALQNALRFQTRLSGALAHPLTLRHVVQGDLGQYSAVFVPSGPAPTIDLMADPALGMILRYFHTHHKMTVLLCHGPTALLAATRDPQAMQTALREGRLDDARKLAAGWPYHGYQMTVFSDEEESIAAKSVFHAEPLLYPEQAPKTAGGDVSTASGWQVRVVRDRELITGQNPASDHALMDVVLPTMLAGK